MRLTAPQTVHPEVRNIIFDLCGPILTIDIHRIDRNLQALGVDSAQPYMDLHRAGITKLYDSGLISSEEFCSRVRDLFRCQIPDSEILRFWNDVIVACPIERLRLIHQVHSLYKVFLLSNCDVENARTFPQHIDRVAGYPLTRQDFDELFFSSWLKLRKPDPEVFEHILDKHRLQPAETLFIDDCRKHCESALTVGLQVHWLEQHEDILQLFSNDGRLI